MPKVYQNKKFYKIRKHDKDMQDIEFTVENNKLMDVYRLDRESGLRKLQSRSLSTWSRENLISKKEAILRIDPNTLDTLLTSNLR